jgi:hypothetical protein
MIAQDKYELWSPVCRTKYPQNFTARDVWRCPTELGTVRDSLRTRCLDGHVTWQVLTSRSTIKSPMCFTTPSLLRTYRGENDCCVFCRESGLISVAGPRPWTPTEGITVVSSQSHNCGNWESGRPENTIPHPVISRDLFSPVKSPPPRPRST